MPESAETVELGLLTPSDDQVGDVEAMRKISSVRVPSQQPAVERTADGYWQFYNPGGPGNNPTEGISYSQGSPDHTVPVTIAIDDPMTVTYIDLRVAD